MIQYIAFGCRDCFDVSVETVKELPPLIDYNKLFPLLDSYDSFSDYAGILQPLMLLEIWESVSKSER